MIQIYIYKLNRIVTLLNVAMNSYTITVTQYQPIISVLRLYSYTVYLKLLSSNISTAER
jgi:hypothetical protein